MTKRRLKYVKPSVSEWPEAAFFDAPILTPRIIARQIDVVPVHRSYVVQPGVFEGASALPQRGDGAFEVVVISEDDGGGDEIQAARAVSLRFECPVTNLA